MRSRGLQPATPLPIELGLFDKQGLPLATQQRDNWLKLQNWLADDEAIFHFAFSAQELTLEEHDFLRSELALLRQQPWSPQAGVQAILEDWPATENVYECTLEVAEQELLAACQQFLQAVK